MPDLVLQPKQFQLYQMMRSGQYQRILFGGALGGAKSHGLRAVNLMRRFDYPGTTSLLFRRTWPELQKNHVDPMFRAWPSLREYWNANDKILRFPNGSSTTFASADDERGIEKFMGPEYGDVLVDQGEQISEEWHDRLLERNRQTGVPGFRAQYVITANPGGISHGFLRRVFVERKRYLPHENPEDFAFIPAFAWDNVEWSRDALGRDGLTEKEYYAWPEEKRFQYFIERTDYGKKLNARPGKRRNAMLLGMWDQFEGQFFDVFDPDGDPVPVDYVEVKPWMPTWLSMDWGWTHKFSVHWHRQIDDQRVMTYRELTGSGQAPEEIAEQIGALTKEGKEHPQAFFLGGDAFAHRTDAETIDLRLARVLAKFDIPGPTRAHDYAGSRIARARMAYDRLARKTWLIANVCKGLINVLPDLVHDPNRQEDVLKVEGDDEYDSATYGLLVPTPELVLPLEERVARRIEKFQKGIDGRVDPQAIAMASRIAASEERMDVPFVSLRRHMRPMGPM